MFFTLRPLSKTARCSKQFTSQWRAYSAVLPDGPVKEETTNRATKRFWKTVTLDHRDDSFAIKLDERAVKTPSGNTLLIPRTKTLLATLVATEWENQEKALKPYALPMTSLASRAIDTLSDAGTREEVRIALLEYLDTDTVCFYQDYPDSLVELQSKHWDPLLSWATTTFNVELLKFDSILSNAQPEATKRILGEVVAKFNQWELAAMERATYSTKSFLIGLALVKQHLTAEQAALAAQVEVNSQITRWGEVEDTHDVDFHDVRRQLGSAACLLASI